MAQNVFIAIGGSGTKVAEALVRLLSIGIPTGRDENGVLTSAGDKLEIWRLDPDLSAASEKDLDNALEDYRLIQDSLSGSDAGVERAKDRAASQWAMDVDLNVRHINPLLLEGVAVDDNTRPTLRGFLDSGLQGVANRSSTILDIFYEDKELDIEINKGFYQKPFIGAAVMGLLADSLATNGSDADQKCNISRFNGQVVRFFLCGSLHGGTGACGIPVIGSFLKERSAGNKDWVLGAGLLAPYSKPGGAPYPKLAPGERLTDEAVASCVAKLRDSDEYRNLPPGDLQALARQLLNGFYADPDELVDRAAQGFRFFKDRIADNFHTVYVAGKKEPDTLDKWSNGGASQTNPSNTTEIVMALAAIGFFAGSAPAVPRTCLLPRATKDSEARPSGGLLPGELPSIEVPRYGGARELDVVRFEQVLLATGVLAHLVLRQIPWDERTKDGWPHLENLWKYYEHSDQRRHDDREAFDRSFVAIKKAVDALLGKTTKGWEPNSGRDLERYFSRASSDVDSVTNHLVAPKKGLPFFRRGEKLQPLTFGTSELLTTVVDFGKWGTSGEATLDRGAYLRRCWSKLYDLCAEKSAAGA